MADPKWTEDGDLTEACGPAAATRRAGTGRLPGAVPPGHGLSPTWAQSAEFFALVRRIESTLPAQRRVGGEAMPADEWLRFRAWDSVGFAPRDVIAFEPASDDGPHRIVVGFMGLYGPTSPLPAHINERAIVDEETGRNLRDVLDVFNHRFVSLLVRIWRKYRYFLDYRPGGSDPTSRKVMALAGLDRDTEGPFGTIEPARLLRYAGLLAMPTSPAATLTAIVSDYFDGLASDVEPMVLRWVAIPLAQRTRLGTAASELGVSMIAGARVRDVSGRFRLVLGPLDRATFRAFLPDSAQFTALCDLVRLAVRDPLECEIVLALGADEVPRWRLGTAGQLGYDTWSGRTRGEQRVHFMATAEHGRAG